MTSKGINETHEIKRASGIFAFFTLVSRVLGLVRNQLLSHFFGAGLLADAFIAAFTIPNALRRLFGEGALTPAIVSLLTRSLHSSEPELKEGEKLLSWQRFISNAFIWLSILVSVITVIGIWASPFLVSVYVPDFQLTPGKMELTVSLTQLLFPFILLMTWFAFFMGVLNTFRSFGSAAAGPAVMNIAVIVLAYAALGYVFKDSEYRIYIYCGTILLGGLAQAAVQLPDLIRHKAYPRWHFQWKDARVTELGMLLVPSILAMGIYQLNIIVNRIFASPIEGAVSHLYYADLLLELPVALIATSIGTAVIPSFSRLIASDDRIKLAETFEYAWGAIATLAFPATAGLIVLAQPLICTIFLTGKFTPHDADVTAATLVGYAIGLPFFSFLRVVVPLFFAEKNTRTPALIGLVALGVNLAAAWFFSSRYQAPGIALATSISSIANILILFVIVFKKHRHFPWKNMASNCAKISIAAITMALALAWLKTFIPSELWYSHGLSWMKCALLFALVATGAVLFFVLASLLRVPYAHGIMNGIRRRF